jgi:hypothetical protein
MHALKFSGSDPRLAPAVRRALLVLALVPALAGLAAAQGLKLDTATEKETDSFDRPNPHFELGCTECHEGTPVLGKDTIETVKFVNGEEGNVKLCYKCHEASENLHPINVDPLTATPPVKVPKEYPLERLGAEKGKVVCSTCHFIHAKTAGLKLLRGFPESSLPEDVAKAKFKDRRELCKSCHGEGLRDKSPHKGKIAGGKTCSFCHAVEPKEGVPVKFTKNLVQVCDFCHAATKGGHFLLVNPFADPNLKDEIAKANVPMVGGEFTCVSCHNPHGGTGEEKFLRKEFVALALKSARVRPHYMKAFCEACHTVRPKLPKGAPGAQTLAEIPLREGGDPVKLCNRCHESGLSKANAHPIKKVPDSFLPRIPKGWPLSATGELTCMTCHTGGDSPTLDPLNPSFLRGGPYDTRNGMCWTCHLREEFAGLNPHAKVQKLEGCEFCHEARPDLKKFQAGEKQEVKFKGDIVVLCIRCHEDSAHPGGRDHTGPPDKELMKAKNIKIGKGFPLDRLGRMTCATCHNPHAYGELRGTESGQMVCSNCHPF